MLQDIGTKKLAVETQGTGESLMLLHGLGSTANVWEPQVRHFSNRFTTLRYDLDGAGRSPLSGALSIDTWVADLVAILDTYKIEKARFVGHSLGTLILQHFVVRYPARVIKLALLGVNRAPPDARRQAVRDRVAKVRAEGIAAITETVVKGGLSPHTLDTKPEIVGFVRELLTRQSQDGYAASCEAMASSQAADISRIACPVLVVSGADDAVSPPANGEAFAKELPNGTFLAIAQCGHWLPIEQPAAVNAALDTFL